LHAPYILQIGCVCGKECKNIETNKIIQNKLLALSFSLLAKGPVFPVPPKFLVRVPLKANSQ
jgi:hypothetical protein